MTRLGTSMSFWNSMTKPVSARRWTSSSSGIRASRIGRVGWPMRNSRGAGLSPEWASAWPCFRTTTSGLAGLNTRCVTERAIDKHGQSLLVPEIEIEGWWTSLDPKEEEVIHLYADHGTSEQFHSEFKTDLDIGRLPFGKFDTNALVLGCSMRAYNLLRWIGQNGLLGPHSPRRHKAKRRRLKTVMQDLIYLTARVVRNRALSEISVWQEQSLS